MARASGRGTVKGDRILAAARPELAVRVERRPNVRSRWARTIAPCRAACSEISSRSGARSNVPPLAQLLAEPVCVEGQEEYAVELDACTARREPRRPPCDGGSSGNRDDVRLESDVALICRHLRPVIANAASAGF